jgi:hypothetical protein
MKFLDLFDPITKGDFGLTEEAVYKSIQLGNRMVPFWGGNREHVHADRFVDEKARTKHNAPVRVFEGEGIIISLDGSAGNMTFKKGERFALNHHAGFFEVKKNSDLIDPDFFSIFYQQLFRAASVSEGSKTLTLDAIYAIDFDIPSMPLQRRIMAEIRPILDRRYRLYEMLARISVLKRKVLSVEYRNFQVQGISVADVLACMNGNAGLTESEIYQKVCESGERYQVLSSSTLDETELGWVPLFNLNGKIIKVFQDKEGILVSRNGRAGSIKFLPVGKYTLTDHAYILHLRDDCPYNVLLQWFAFQHGNAIGEYTSSSDNATWDKTGFFKSAVIDIPDIPEQQAIIDEYERLGVYEKRLRKADTMIESLLARIVAD